MPWRWPSARSWPAAPAADGRRFERGPQVGISFLVGVLRPTLFAALDRVGLPRVRNPPAPHPTRSEPERGFRVANIKSQIKRNKQNEKARQRNKAVKSSLKTAVRKFREAA